jgi:hypothetical protein
MRVKSKKICFNKGFGTQIKIPPGISVFKLLHLEAPKPTTGLKRQLGNIEVLNSNDDIIKVIELNILKFKENEDIISFEINESLDVNEQIEFYFRHMNVPHNYNNEVTLIYEISEIQAIDTTNPEIDFESHVKEYHNSKIVFSAPFGSGKSYFLDYFFEKRNEEFEVFKVYPVNYSVASNEDIFKFIKTDILFQLLGKDVEFDIDAQSLIESFEEFAFLNPKELILSFLKNVSQLNEQTKIISKNIKKLDDGLKPVKDYNQSKNVNDKEKAIAYIKEAYEKEGSPFEDNFYTQLIRQLLERLLIFSTKKSVLIIEDLDRMDPEHVFRILNVISAHYDLNKTTNDGSHNKFGFDKIIVVCDVKNIKSIFHHKYGIGTDFKGYFNKYSSSKPFDYSSESMISYHIENRFGMKQSGFKPHFYNLISNLKMVISIFNKAKLLSFRDLIKLDKELDSFFVLNKSTSILFERTIEFLVENLGVENLLYYLEVCKRNKIELSKRYDYSLQDCICMLIPGLMGLKEDTYFRIINGVEYYYYLDRKNNNVEFLKGNFQPKENLPFNPNNYDLDLFYDLFTENVKLKYQVG